MAWLPPYALELNPVSQVWTYLKYGRLANFAPDDVREIQHEVRHEARLLGRRQPLLRSLFRHSDEEAEIPACPACGAADTWENRQGTAFRARITEIDGSASLDELAAIGKRVYAVALEDDADGVAWTHYRIRRAALEAAVALGAEARALIAEVERASERELPRVGAKLYRVQRVGAVAVTAPEWRRIWQAYGARRRARAA